jgi:hypothetical protein
MPCVLWGRCKCINSTTVLVAQCLPVFAGGVWVMAFEWHGCDVWPLSQSRHRRVNLTQALMCGICTLQVDEAFGVADTLAGLGIDLTEAEFAALLHVCQFDRGWARPEALLRRIGRELTTLSTVRPCLLHVASLCHAFPGDLCAAVKLLDVLRALPSNHMAACHKAIVQLELQPALSISRPTRFTHVSGMRLVLCTDASLLVVVHRARWRLRARCSAALQQPLPLRTARIQQQAPGNYQKSQSTARVSSCTNLQTPDQLDASYCSMSCLSWLVGARNDAVMLCGAQGVRAAMGSRWRPLTWMMASGQPSLKASPALPLSRYVCPYI